MIAPIVNTHVSARRHVAIDTLHVVNLMLMMVCTREFLRQVASAADFTGLSAASEPRRMWIMTIAATDTGLVHTTLQERAVYIHLVHDLPIGVIKEFVEQCRPVGIVQDFAKLVVACHQRAARVTTPTGVRLLRWAHDEFAAFGDSCRRIHLPDGPAIVVEVDRQTGAAGAGPGASNMTGPRAMAGLATDVDFCPGRCEGIRLHRIVFLQIGGMTLGAHVVPVLFTTGPVQQIVMRNEFVRIQVVPALPTIGATPGIPGDRQRLYMAIRHLNQVLLQRRNAKGEFDRELLEFTVCIVSADQVISIACEKCTHHIEILELDAGEIAQNGVRRRLLHSKLVMRSLPQLELRRVALAASFRSGKSKRHWQRRGLRRRIAGYRQRKQKHRVRKSDNDCALLAPTTKGRARRNCRNT